MQCNVTSHANCDRDRFAPLEYFKKKKSSFAFRFKNEKRWLLKKFYIFPCIFVIRCSKKTKINKIKRKALFPEILWRVLFARRPSRRSYNIAYSRAFIAGITTAFTMKKRKPAKTWSQPLSA